MSKRLKTIALCFMLMQTVITPNPAISQNRTIAIFGSSVAKGSGDTTNAGGYAGMIRDVLERRGYRVVNVSRGGDNTTKILPRFETDLLPQNPGYVIIGLSLGNEGIVTQSALKRNRVFEQFRAGLAQLVRLCREHNMQPVIVNCYTRNDFGPEQYEAVQRMNLLISGWGIPMINSLGAIDDGAGHWAEGYWQDRSHPNLAGHREIFYAFVPGLFDALVAGKTPPEKIRSNNCLAVTGKNSAKPLIYIPADTIHSFTVSFCVKTSHEGTVAAIRGLKSSVSFKIKQGKIICDDNNVELFTADTTNENNDWQYIVLSHRYATRTTDFYVNGKLAGTHKGSRDFTEFILGGSGDRDKPAPEQARYRDLLIYRSALNAGEVEALYYNQILPASLEIYAPLNDTVFNIGATARNDAQSTSKLMIMEDNLLPATENEPPKAK